MQIDINHGCLFVSCFTIFIKTQKMWLLRVFLEIIPSHKTTISYINLGSKPKSTLWKYIFNMINISQFSSIWCPSLLNLIWSYSLIAPYISIITSTITPFAQIMLCLEMLKISKKKFLWREMMNIFYYLGIYIFWNGILKIIKYLVDMHWNYPCTMIHKIISL
jgi:hypothetical protein